jgi:hypothetical protein
MNIYVAGDPVESASDAIRWAVDWWATAGGIQEPNYDPPFQKVDAESISGLIQVRPEPGDSRADVAAYERSLRKRAVEYARRRVAEAGHRHRGHVSSSAGERRVGGDWRKYCRYTQ